MKLYLSGCLVTLCVVSSAKAQETSKLPAGEVGMTYSFFHAKEAGDIGYFNANGGSGSVNFNVSRSLSLVADVGAYRNGTGSQLHRANTTMTYLFGPRFTWRRSKVVPYVQFLFGGAHAWDDSLVKGSNASLTQNGFATAAGGGVDYMLTRRLIFKPLQVEYVMTQLPGVTGVSGGTQNDIRCSAGVAYRFGGK